MSDRSIEIVSCPPSLSVEALAIVLRDLSPQQRREIVTLHSELAVDSLLVALDGDELCDAAWGQRQPGNTAVLWPPKATRTANDDTAGRLISAVAAALDAAGVYMTQVLLPDRQAAIVPALKAAGFTCLADLLYLSWESAAAREPPSQQLTFEPYHASQRDRLTALIEKTYEATHDCAAMNGKRPISEVLDGYQATGVFRPENWRIVRTENCDVGVLLLADHRAAKHWELMYMGVVPSARGRRFGHHIVRHAQQLAHVAKVERIVLAVDAENFPAIKMYNETGFTAWDQRTVFVRFQEVGFPNAKSSLDYWQRNSTCEPN